MRSLYAHPILRGISVRRLSSGSRNPAFLYHQRSSLASSSPPLRPPPLHSITRMASSSSSSVTATTTTTTTSAANARFSAGSDEKTLSKTLETVLESAAAPATAVGPDSRSGGGAGRWALTAGGEGLERSFKFKTFAKTWVSGFAPT